ncbi:VIT and VWA domain-containing protein [Actibacterium sp. 188UL27-1]|uniref:VIT and vWA domain-containing protein n=1 Tax=Actibacterium sp. 188UL27-1 TaxID=2786961 RepID=UPI001958CF3F|nr:VIT and VWA domain-containing protein [Actibacterium sp. 188UL27-1]MBM7069217.1 VWA domain-containing protein [Actibacterium sp. 188UL27-1]
MKPSLLFCLSVAFGMALATATLARGIDDLSGRVVGTAEDGQQVELPLLQAHYDVSIQGDMVTVMLTQTFANPSDLPMRADYLFPLNQRAAVFAMEMEVGDEVVRAKIQKKAKAKATFEKAEKEGKAAALLTQHRPNMFTQSIANLMPGMPVAVTLSYVQPVPLIDGEYQLVVPMVVGPRYQSTPEPATVASADPEAPVVADGWSISQTPAQPPVAGLSLPDTLAEDRVSMEVRIAGGLPVQRVVSDTHELALLSLPDVTQARFAKGREIDNADFVLRYTLGGQDLTTGALTHAERAGGYVSLMVAPPNFPDTALATPRELVFVLDTSGSMSGQPMEASRRFMRAAIQGLRDQDYFRILQFSNVTGQMATSSLPASPENRQAALRYLDGLNAGGGTEMNNAINAAFDTVQPDGAMRIVVFLSDGYIGREAQVLKSIRDRIGAARIYAFGVGTSVNRYLLEAMADEGRGYVRYVDPTADAFEVAETMARDLKTPLLTDIEVDWGDLKITDTVPQHIPDLFAGGSVRVLAWYQGVGRGEVTIRGKVQGQEAILPVQVNLTNQAQPDARSRALPLIWARARIADLERAYAVRDGNPNRIEAQITDLGLKHSLQTRYTSFVAVSEQVVNGSGLPAQSAQVAQAQVKGVSKQAYPSGFSGSSTHEPQTWLGLLVLAALGMLRLHGRWQARA